MSLANNIINGDLDQLKREIALGAPVNGIDEYGFTPLIQTAIVNNIDMTKVLLDAKANVNEQDLTRRTALHWAVDNGNTKLVHLLLEHKANPNAYNVGGQSTLVTALLREHKQIKKHLLKYDANLAFAQDFINAKLLGHRYELNGFVDLANPESALLALDLEGFYLEFTFDIIINSLRNFRNHFIARRLRKHFKDLHTVITALENASELIKFQHYLVDVQQYADRINPLLDKEPLIIPVACDGHALTFVKVGNLLAKCDRGVNSDVEGSVNIYHVGHEAALSKTFIKELVYKKQSAYFIHNEMKDLLSLTPVAKLPLSRQVTGNCSWANVEACVPTLLFMLELAKANQSTDTAELENTALFVYDKWLQWDRDNALHQAISGISELSKARKVARATLLARVLFQTSKELLDTNLQRANKILSILSQPDVKYVLEGYVETYIKRHQTPEGKDLEKLLEVCGVNI